MTTPAKPNLTAEDVEVQTEPREGGEVQLSVRVLPGPVAQIRDNVVKLVSRRANVPGFRKGKAPRALLERMLDQDYIKEQVIEGVLGDAYDLAIEKAEIKPLSRAQVRDAEIAEDGSLTFQATVTLRPEITLGEYRGLEITRYLTPVTDEQVENEITRLRERLARFEELPEGAAIEKNDLAVVDYEMLVDGEKREESSATGYPLEVGTDDLFPQLNDALPGHRPGEVVEVETSFPETHPEEALRGKTAVYRVTIQSARRRTLPPVDEKLAQDLSGGELATPEELRARMRSRLEDIGTAVADQDVRNQLIRKVSEQASLDVPEAMVAREAERRVQEINQELERRNDNLMDYLQRTGRSYEDWHADVEIAARQDVRQALVLDEIGEREDIEVTEEELDAEIHHMAEHEGLSEAQMHERLHDEAELRRISTRLYNRKVVSFLVDNAQITEEVHQPEAEAEGEKPAEEQAAE